MEPVAAPPSQVPPLLVNVARRLADMAREIPEAVAVAETQGYSRERRRYRVFTFAELDADSDRIAAGLRGLGVKPGTRLALLVRPGIEFISLVFALLKSGAVTILIDPGMGRKHLLDCLADAQPEGFVGIPRAQIARLRYRERFPLARLNVTVGRRWFWGGATLAQLRRSEVVGDTIAPTLAEDPAAIIFTSGGTGPPKGVLFTHGNFDAQVSEIQAFYEIRRGEVDVPAFPLFGLFNCAMGVTAVVPNMNASRPATVDPSNIVEAVHDWRATQAFASPAVWRRVGNYCSNHGITMPGLRRVLSAGAPVPAEVLEKMQKCIDPAGDIHTPYGATEALPVASIAGREVLRETAAKTRMGAGVCVGRRFPGIAWKVIRITDEPIPTLADAEDPRQGEIGELIVSGPVVTRTYVTRTEANALAKIADGDRIWHRMGDVGYFDDRGRFWMCGRKVHRVVTAAGPLYSICCEAVFNQHSAVLRSALVGMGPRGNQAPAIVVELRHRRGAKSSAARTTLFEELRCLARTTRVTANIDRFFVHPGFPVDVRHNVKIDREELARWAAGQAVTGTHRT
ncbi:MAG: fatty acid CoA ligase family protein [Planctomycetota bacterium]